MQSIKMFILFILKAMQKCTRHQVLFIYNCHLFSKQPAELLNIHILYCSLY